MAAYGPGSPATGAARSWASPSGVRNRRVRTGRGLLTESGYHAPASFWIVILILALADAAVPAYGERREDGRDRDAPGDGVPGRGGDRAAQHQAAAGGGELGHRVDPDPGLQPAGQGAG